MDFDTWVLTIMPRYEPTDDSPLLRYLRACWKFATGQQEAEIDRLRRAEGHAVATALGQQETIEGLRAELAECKQDAERYRWLRSDDCPFSCYEQEGPDNWGWCPTSSRDLDEAIDAAMAGGEHG